MRRLTAIATVVMLLASPLTVAFAAETVPGDHVAQITAEKGTGVYLVLLRDEPVVLYEGGVAGLAATHPATGEKADRHSPAVRAYTRYLHERHDEALRLARVDPAARLYDYTFASNGFAARLTAHEAARLSAQPGVVAVVEDQIRRITTDSSPYYLGLTHQQGPWETGYTGEGVVVAVIDTGIWPEHPSFADDGSFRGVPSGFTGSACDFGSAVSGAQAFNAADADFTCNGKLLAAGAFGEGFHGGTGEGLDPGEYLSARDADGHGSHVASTAAGNSEVPATVLGHDWGNVSGIAPRARIAAYKACWSASSAPGGCAVSDLVAAIDQAVADGADVLNYSIDSTSAALGADDLALLAAAGAGVMVATPAGNGGPGAATVGSPAAVPWVTSVTAATQVRELQGMVLLGFGAPLTGVTLTGGLPPSLLLDAAALGNALCDPSIAFTSSIAGAVVLCRRGGLARVAKSRAVFEQGGAGMILTNVADDDSLDADNHYLPSLHVTAETGEAIAAYIALSGGQATAELIGGEKIVGPGSVVAQFSSRGPNGLGEDILKPDVAAPGVNILAATTPTALVGSRGERFRLMSGTSMSSPHVAGVFALLTQAHPRWSPAMAKSALMTSTRHDVWVQDGSTPAEVFDTGSGYIQPGGNIHRRGSPFNPGLVYDASVPAYTAFLCGAGFGTWRPGTCNQLADASFSLDASDLNLPSIGVAELVGSQTVTRSVTSVADKIRVFEAQVRAPAGFTVTVEPATLTLAPGETGTFTVTVTTGVAPRGEWRFGSLTWHSAGYRVDTPLAVRALEFAAPDEITGAGASGEAKFEVQFGDAGDYLAASHGLVAADRDDDAVVDDPDNDVNAALASGIGVTLHTVDVPGGTAATRFSLFDDATDGNHDLDLYVFGPDGSFVGGSGSTTSTEEVTIQLPEGGVYTVVVHGWRTEGPDAAYTLFSWSVPLAAGGSLAVDEAPSTAVTGSTRAIELSWSGLDAATRYLGAISHSGSDGLMAMTLVSVDAMVFVPAQTAPRRVPQPAPVVGRSR